jgi:hypothetical protein
MRTNTLVLILLGGLAAYVLTMDRRQRPPTSLEPVGGTTTGQPDTFNSILGAVSAVFNAVGSIAGTQPKTV